jgi:hypothetical protein
MQYAWFTATQCFSFCEIYSLKNAIFYILYKSWSCLAPATKRLSNKLAFKASKFKNEISFAKIIFVRHFCFAWENFFYFGILRVIKGIYLIIPFLGKKFPTFYLNQILLLHTYFCY